MWDTGAILAFFMVMLFGKRQMKERDNERVIRQFDKANSFILVDP